MLLYPPGESALGALLTSRSRARSARRHLGVGRRHGDTIPQRREVPVVLLVWGPGRIVPGPDHQLHGRGAGVLAAALPDPRQGHASGLKVLDDERLGTRAEDASEPSEKIAKACYDFTRAQKEALARANVANSVESIVGMLPF